MDGPLPHACMGKEVSVTGVEDSFPSSVQCRLASGVWAVRKGQMFVSSQVCLMAVASE